MKDDETTTPEHRLEAFNQSVETGEVFEKADPHIGLWTCKCGTMTWHPPQSNGAIPSVVVFCVYCGDTAEILAEPIDEAST